MVKRIGFVGYECEDIILYMAKILMFLGNRVMVIDQSKQYSIFGILGVPIMQGTQEYELPEYYMGDIKITTRKEEPEEADILLIHFGYQTQNAEIELCDELILSTDEVIFHAQLLYGVMQTKKRTWLLVKNGFEVKYDISYLESAAGRQCEAYFYLPFDERDARKRCYLGIDRSIRIRELSMGMKQLLAGMLAALELGKSKKELALAMKKA